MTRLSEMFRPEPVAFSVGDVEYQITIGLDDVAALEKACDAGLGAIGRMITNGHVSVMLQIMALTAKRVTEVGPQPIGDIAEIGALAGSEEAVLALGEALTVVKNALSPEPQPAQSESGSEPVSTRKRSGGSRNGQ